jgi:hypothetical protein
VDEYREGTVKSTPPRGMKETLNPCPHQPSQGRGMFHARLLACLL